MWGCAELAAAAGWGLAANFRNPAVDDISGTTAAVIGINVDGRGRAVFHTGTAFHTGVAVDDFGLVVLHPEDAVWTDQLAVAAADAFFKSQLQDGGIIKISETFHENSPYLDKQGELLIPFLNQDGNEKASEQRRDSTKKYSEEPHSAAAEVNA